MKTGSLTSAKALLLPIFIASTIVESEALGQVERIVSAEQALECFEESRRAGEGHSDCDSSLLVTVETIVISPNTVPSETVQDVLDGLERLALESDHLRVRIAASINLATLGEPHSKAGRPLPGMVDRMASIYSRSNDLAVRSSMVKGMIGQAEVDQAIEFLKDVAMEFRPEDIREEWPPAYIALTILERMGPQGRAALQQLHARGKIKNARARGYLEYVARNSYREPRHPRKPN